MAVSGFPACSVPLLERPLMAVFVSAVKAEARDLIKKFFGRVPRCESEGDWMHLRGTVGVANGTRGGAGRREAGQATQDPAPFPTHNTQAHS